MDFIAVYNYKNLNNEEEDLNRILLYHSFRETNDNGISLNEKLSVVGIIQGIWKFTHNFNTSDTISGIKYIDTRLDHRRLIVLEVELNYFIALGVKDGNYYPCAYYVKELYDSYKFFCMHCGAMADFDKHEELSDKLNEHFAIYWYELNILPEAMYNLDLSRVFWHRNYKVSDRKLYECRWETKIKKEILLDLDSYLGLRDICVYNLTRDKQRHPEKYGLVSSFSPEFESLPVLSNWIYHLDRIFCTPFSPHVLSGHVRLSRSNGEIDAGNSKKSCKDGSIGKNIWNKVSLPISMTYDVLSEVGNLTWLNTVVCGINQITNGLNTITNRIFWPGRMFIENQDLDTDSENYGFLISPISFEQLPKSYHFRRFQLQFEKDHCAAWYKLIFWHYKDYLVVLIFEDTFTRLWEKEYLYNLNLKLYNSLLILESSLVQPKGDTDKFVYAVLNKETGKIESSLPLINAHDGDKDKSSNPLKLVVYGIEDTLRHFAIDPESISRGHTTSIMLASPVDNNKPTLRAQNVQSHWGVGLSGLEITKWKRKPNKSGHVTSKTENDTVFGSMSYKKILEFNNKLCKLYSGVLTSSNKKDSVKEEKLVKLGNGILCYFAESSEEVIVIIKDWFIEDSKLLEYKRNPSANDDDLIIMDSLGKDVRKWWVRRTSKY